MRPSAETYDGLLTLVNEVIDMFEDVEHTFRLVGRRQYPTELRIWVGDHFCIWIVPDVNNLNWSLNDITAFHPTLVASSYRRPQNRYVGRGWVQRLVDDITCAVWDAYDHI